MVDPGSRITVIVPNSPAAIQRMNDASDRAYKVLPALNKLREAASMPRVWPTDDITTFTIERSDIQQESYLSQCLICGGRGFMIGLSKMLIRSI